MAGMIGIVADDITGANDIGIMVAKSGATVHVYSLSGGLRALQPEDPLPDALIVDTSSRLDLPEEAYRKVYESTMLLRRLGCDRFYNKTCSVFRGNIGAEFDAMLDALGIPIAVVVLGFPKNGRQTLHGTHYVWGKRLEESEFARDPVHPMTESEPVRILQQQTKRKVDRLDIEVIDQGPDAIRRAIDAKRRVCGYLILDVRDQRSLADIAEAVRDEPVLCGSSGIAEELGGMMALTAHLGAMPNLPLSSDSGILVASGSLMPQSAAQIDDFKRKGGRSYIVRPALLLDGRRRDQHLSEIAEAVAGDLSAGLDTLVHTANDSGDIAETKRLGLASGLSSQQVARVVSDSLAGIVGAIDAKVMLSRFIVAGGETSAAVCGRLGIDGLRILEELEPGLPSCVSLSSPARLFVLKSGSFGRPDFFERAIRHLRSIADEEERS